MTYSQTLLKGCCLSDGLALSACSLQSDHSQVLSVLSVYDL